MTLEMHDPHASTAPHTPTTGRSAMHNMTRRGASRPARLLAGAAGAALLLTACTSGSGGGGSSSGSPSPTDRTTVTTFGESSGPVDQLNWGLPYGEPNTIDPPNTAYYSSALVAMSMCEALTRMNPDYSTSPGLAELSQPDPLTMVYKVRSGVKFWDGAALTADDVVWSLDHARDPATITSFLFANVASVTATGPLEVTLKLSAPDAMLPIELATFAGAVQQKAFSEKAGKNLGNATTGVMCTGPLKFESWTSGQSITLAANDTYWDTAHPAQAKKVKLTFAADSNTLAQALTSGELDGAYEVPAATIPKMQSATSGTLVFGAPTQLNLQLAVLSTTGPLNNADIRKAVYQSIDSAGLAKVVYHEAASANYTVLNRDSWHNGQFPDAAQAVWQAAYDGFEKERSGWGTGAAIADAKALATKAGYKGDPIVIGTLAGDATLSQVAQLVQAEGKAAGLSIEIKQLQPIDYSNAFVDPKARQGLDMIFTVSFNGAPTPLEPMLFNFLPDSFYNYTGYNNAEVTAAITEARKTTDLVAQSKLLVNAQSIYEKEYLTMGLVQMDELLFLNKRLGGAVASFAYLNSPALALIGQSK